MKAGHLSCIASASRRWLLGRWLVLERAGKYLILHASMWTARDFTVAEKAMR